MLPRVTEETPQEVSSVERGMSDHDEPTKRAREASTDITMEDAMESSPVSSDIERAMRELLQETTSLTGSQLVHKVTTQFHAFKLFLNAKEAKKELQSRVLQCLLEVVTWELPHQIMAMEIVNLALNKLSEHSDPEIHEVVIEILRILFQSPNRVTSCPGIDAVFGTFVRLVEEGYEEKEENVVHMKAISDVLCLIVQQGTSHRSYVKLIPKMENFFASKEIVGHQFDYCVVKIACHALKMYYSAVIEMTPQDLETFSNNVFKAIAKILSTAETYTQRVSLMSCIKMMCGNRLNLPLLRYITEGDLLIRLNDGWQHETMVGMCIVSVFVECLKHVTDEDFIAVADNCLRLYNVYSSTDDYQMKERLITLLSVFSNRMKMAFETLPDKDLSFFQKAAEVLLHKATHEIQALNAPKEMWKDVGFVTFVRSTMPSLINITTNSIVALSGSDTMEKARAPTPSSVRTDVSGIHEDNSGSDKNNTVVSMEEEKLSVAAADDEEDTKLPDRKRPLTQVECLEIYKSMCCMYEAGSTANAIVRERENEDVGNDMLLQLHEIHELIRMSLKMFLGSFRKSVLKQWIKLMIPVVFVMSLKDKFMMTVFECFRRKYAEFFAPHMLTFILQILKNKDNVLEYLSNVVSYSEGVMGLFSLGDWEPCSRRLEGYSTDDILDMSQEVATRVFVAFSDLPETLTACQNEIMYLTKAVSKLQATRSDRIITVAVAMFRGISKVKDNSLAHIILRVPVDVIARKVLRAGADVHRDWLELMMVAASNGLFSQDLVSICAKPALCILRDFNWSLVTAALEMLESWSESIPSDQFYNMLARIRIYRSSDVQPHFIHCLSKYLQDHQLPNYKQNANIVMNIFSKMGSAATHYTRDLRIKRDIPYKIAIAVDKSSSASEQSRNTASTTAESPSEPSDIAKQEPSNSLPEEGQHKTREGDDVSIDTRRSDITMCDATPDAIPLGIPVIEGLHSVIRQMEKDDIIEATFEGCAGFLLSAVAPVMDFDVSLSEVWLQFSRVVPTGSDNTEEVTRYHTQEHDKEFVYTLMHALVKALAVGKRKWKSNQHYRDLELLKAALVRYLIFATKTKASNSIVVAIEPSIVLEAFSERLHIKQEHKEYNFDLQFDHVDPMEADVVIEFFAEVFSQAQDMQCTTLCNSIINLLFLGCYSHESSRKIGSCIALGRLCNDHAVFLQPMIIDIAQAVAQLSDGRKRDLEAMKGVMEALLEVDEPVIIQWAASLLEHPLWYLRTVGQLCLRAAKDKPEVEASVKKLKEVARNLQAPDVQMYLATFKDGDISLIDVAISGMQPYMQSIAENGNIEDVYRSQAELYLELIGQLLTNEEYARAAEVMEDTFNHVLVYFLKLLVIGSPEIVCKAKTVLSNTKNVTVSPKILSMALEEYIFQLQTIFDETLLDRILEVVKEYRGVVDEALTESLFNVAKALVEGTIHSSVNDEYKNVHFIDYMIFLSSMGAGRACADVIFGQWFTSIDPLKKGVIIPGSVAYGIWQVLSYNDAIYSVFNSAMQMEYLCFLYFANGKADIDHILWDALSSLESENHLTSILCMSLVSWLCEGKSKLVSESKHFNKLVDTMLSIASSSNMQIDDLLTEPGELEDGQILKWKMGYNCATVLFKMLPGETLQLKLSNLEKQKDLTKLEKLVAREFVLQYPGRRKEGMLNPIVGGHIFEMRNYQLKHLFWMLNKEMVKDMNTMLDDVVGFCWQSINEGDAMGKLLSICCLANVVELFNTPTVGAVAVFKKFIDILVSEDVYMFLHMHYTVKLDVRTSQGKTTCTLYQHLRSSAHKLVKALSGVTAPNEIWKGTKEVASTDPKTSVWYAILVLKICDYAGQPRLLITLLGIFLMYLHEDISMFSAVLIEVMKVLCSEIFPSMCNLSQGGALDAFFGALAVMHKSKVKLDSLWVMKTSLKHILASIVTGHMTPDDTAPYIPFIVNCFVKAPHFDVFGNCLRQLTMREASFSRFNQSHLLDNMSYHPDPYKPLGTRRSHLSHGVDASNVENKARKLEQEKRRYKMVGSVILDIIVRVLDRLKPDATAIRQITDELTTLWYIKNDRIMKYLQLCLFKMCCIFRSQFANTDRSLLNQTVLVRQQTAQKGKGAQEMFEPPKMEESKTETEEVECPALAEEQNIVVTEAYLDFFPKWLIGIVLDEFKAAKNASFDKLKPEEADEPLDLVWHYLETATITSVATLTSTGVSGKNTPNESCPSLSRMCSSNINEHLHDAKQVPESEMGLNLSTAMRSYITMLRALSSDHRIMLQVLKDLLPVFLDVLDHSLVNMGDLESFSRGMLRLSSNVYLISEQCTKDPLIPKDHDQDGSKRFMQLIEVLIWALPALDNMKPQIVEIIRKFTVVTVHPFNETLLKIATDIAGACYNAPMDVDEKPLKRTPSHNTRNRHAERSTKSASRGHSRKEARVDSSGNKENASSKNLGPHVTIFKFIYVADTQKENMIKWADLKNLLKGTGKSYSRQLLEKGEAVKSTVSFVDIISTTNEGKFNKVSHRDLVNSMRPIYMKMDNRESLLLETVYAFRHISSHESRAEKYLDLMLISLEQAGSACLPVRNKLIAYLSCLSKNRRHFLDVYKDLDLPRDLFSLMLYVLSSDVSFNRDNGFYIPLYLDILFTSALDDWDVSVTDYYPCLPPLVPKDANSSVRQIDLLCQEDEPGFFKENVMILKQFRAMQGDVKQIARNTENHIHHTYEVTNHTMESIKSALKKMHEFHVIYFQHVVKVSRFKECMRRMWHSDEEFASKVWESIFPQVHATCSSFQQDEICKAVCRYASREEHTTNTSGLCATIFRGAIKCYPPVHMPPEMLKYIAACFVAWDEVLYHLEKQLLFQPLEVTRVATVLSDIYERLNLSDMSIGAYRTWVITQETRLALCFLQHAKWKQAQREFNSVMESLALTGQTAEAVSSFDESKIWYNGWVQATMQLGEWDLLRDVSFVAGDRCLFLQSSTILQDWGEVIPDDGLNEVNMMFALDDAEATVNRVYQQLHTDLSKINEMGENITQKFVIKCKRNAEHIIRHGKNRVLDSWALLPKGLSEAHVLAIQTHQRLVEVDEGLNYLSDVVDAIDKGNTTETPALLNKWRKRMPRSRDLPSVWSSMLSWRTFMFTTIRNVVLNNHSLPDESRVDAILNLQDLQWTLTKYASITRKAHQLPLIASVILNKAQKFHKSIVDNGNLVSEDCFIIMIEKFKQYLSIPVNVHEALKGLVSMDLSIFPSVGCETLKSHALRLMVEAIDRKSAYEVAKRQGSTDSELASKYLVDALKLEPMVSKNWICWAKYNDKRIDHVGMAQGKESDASWQSELYESAITGYLTAVSIRPQSHWLLLGRVISLLNEIRTFTKTGSCSEAFKTYSDMIPASVWFMWLPQLISGVNRSENLELNHVLQLLLYRLPQQVFYTLRCEYFAQNSSTDSENTMESPQACTMKVLLSTLIASNPSVGTMLESFAATVTHMGRPDFVDEIICAAETIFEECLDLPFNEKVPPHMFNCLSLKMSHRSSVTYDSGDIETNISQMMKDFEQANAALTCGETMNRLLNWISKLKETSKVSQANQLQKQIQCVKMHQFCQHLQMLNMELHLPVLQPALDLLKPKHRQCLGECIGVVSLLPEVKKRKRDIHIVKSISILAQNGQTYVYTVQPLMLSRQKTDQHVTQMFKLLNHYALKYNETRRRDVSLPITNVVSLDPYLCLYEEDPQDETMSTIFSKSVSFKNLVNRLPDVRSYLHVHPAMYNESNLLLLILHKMIMEMGVTRHLLERWRRFNPECVEDLSFTRVYQLFKEKQYPWFTSWYKKTHQDVLMDAYSQICSLVPDDILVKHAMETVDSYQDLMVHKRRMASNYAIQALLGLMFVTPYATPGKLSLNLRKGAVKHLDFRLNYSRDIFVDYSKLRVFRFTRNIKTIIGPICRMGVMPAVVYAMCAAIHTYKIDILGTLTSILADDFSMLQSSIETPRDNNEQTATHSNQTPSQQPSQRSTNGSHSSTPVMMSKREMSPLDEYISLVLSYCSYLRSPTDQEPCNMPINNIICCIIDASADSGTLGKLKTSYQPWF